MDKVFYERWSNVVHVAKRSGLSFAPHLHDEMEIVYVHKGPVTAYVDGTEYTLENGCLCAMFPNQLHSYVDGVTPPTQGNFIIIFKSDILKTFGSDLSSKVPKDPIITDPCVLDKVRKYFDSAVEIKNGEHTYRAEMLNAHAMLILANILPLFEFKSAKTLQKDASADIFAYCNRNFSEDISLDTISKDLNISKTHIMRLFRERFHTSFRAYINQLRIDKAKKLLKTTSLSVTEISISVGYNTIRSFNRAFSELCGTSPREYRSEK